MSIGFRGQVKSAAVSFTTTGDNTIVAAVAGKLIQVVGLLLVSTGTTNITVKDGAANALTGAMPLAAGSPFVLRLDPVMDWFSTTNVANALIINQSGAVQISGTVWFIQK